MFKFISLDFNKRTDEKEKMDDSECDKIKLVNTLKQFEILNILFTSSRRLIKKYVIPIMQNDIKREYSFLDLGGGQGDIIRWLSLYCKKKGYKISITMIDHDPYIVKYAKERCFGYENIKIIQEGAFDFLKNNSFDFVFANHFLHHLTDEEIFKLISIIKQRTKLLFLLNDIRRSKIAYLLYSIFTFMFFHNSFAFFDGRISIRRGFKKQELEKLIKDNEIIVKNAFPFRVFIYYKVKKF